MTLSFSDVIEVKQIMKTEDETVVNRLIWNKITFNITYKIVVRQEEEFPKLRRNERFIRA